MDFPINIDTISLELPIVSFNGSQIKNLHHDVFLSLDIVLIFTNSADIDAKKIMLPFIGVCTACQSNCL